MNGPLSLSLSPLEGERAPEAREGGSRTQFVHSDPRAKMDPSPRPSPHRMGRGSPGAFGVEAANGGENLDRDHAEQV